MLDNVHKAVWSGVAMIVILVVVFVGAYLMVRPAPRCATGLDHIQYREATTYDTNVTENGNPVKQSVTSTPVEFVCKDGQIIKP